jgi:predicted transposase YdaD
MHYDIATKRLMEMGGEDILRVVAGLSLADVEGLDESGQETFDLKRCDYVARCKTLDGREAIAILEFQTRWEAIKALDMALYSLHHRRKHKTLVLPVMILLTADPRATGHYEDENVRASFHLVKLWEMEASALLQPNKPWLWPFAALAKNGVQAAAHVDTLIHESALPRREKSDLITIFTVFIGLKDMEVARLLANKRREIMIESPFYEVIKQEGKVEGKAEGKAEGKVESLREMVWTIIDERFHPVAEGLRARISGVSDLERLRDLATVALRAKSLDEFVARLG